MYVNRRGAALYAFAFASCYSQANGQGTGPSTYPHRYPGQPTGDFGPEWQSYFEVKDKLVNITFDSGRSFAGNLPVQREGHPNNTLFFIGYETSPGSLTAAAHERTEEPWVIWLNGGPGSSSMMGLFYENGPINLEINGTASQNPFSWHKAADCFWLDQPVGVGFATADDKGYIADEDQMADDFIGFLGNLVKVFPSLAKRPLYLTGESYAGTYIPYILKGYFQHSNPPVVIRAIGMGNPGLGSPSFGLGVLQQVAYLPSLSTIQTFPQIIGYNIEAYEYFEEQNRLCGYNVNVTYPQTLPLPPLGPLEPTGRSWYNDTENLAASVLTGRDLPRKGLGARGLDGRVKGAIDKNYQCYTFFNLLDYTLDNVYPWNTILRDRRGDANIYDIPMVLSPPRGFQAAGIFMNNPSNRAALHAPTVKNWQQQFDIPTFRYNQDPSPPATDFLSELAANATANNVRVIIWSGNTDWVVPHLGTEIIIQNTTFGGIRGFTRKPATPLLDAQGKFAGIIHQERGWTYALFDKASHMVPMDVPETAFRFLRDFILGDDKTGFVNPQTGEVVGGENPALAAKILPGGDEIYLGSVTVTATYTYPEATRAAWKEFAKGF